MLACGESGGWASVAVQRLNVDCVATESDSFSFFYLHQRLSKECGTMILQEANKHIFWKKVYKKWSAQVKNNLAVADKLQDLANFLN